MGRGPPGCRALEPRLRLPAVAGHRYACCSAGLTCSQQRGGKADLRVMTMSRGPNSSSGVGLSSACASSEGKDDISTPANPTSMAAAAPLRPVLLLSEPADLRIDSGWLSSSMLSSPRSCEWFVLQESPPAGRPVLRAAVRSNAARRRSGTRFALSSEQQCDVLGADKWDPNGREGPRKHGCSARTGGAAGRGPICDPREESELIQISQPPNLFGVSFTASCPESKTPVGPRRPPPLAWSLP